MYLAKSQGKRGVKCSSCRVRGQKSNLSYRHAELEAVKVKKKKLGMFRHAHCSLIFFILRKGKEKNSFLFFPFHCNRSAPGKTRKGMGKRGVEREEARKSTMLAKLQLQTDL